MAKKKVQDQDERTGAFGDNPVCEAYFWVRRNDEG
jgi:hypothetical protein